jgi:hypothetical protein
VDGDRARRVTTGAVATALVLGLTCFGAALALGLPARAGVTPFGGLVAGLLRADPAAFVGAGVLLLLASPLLRLSGLIAAFWRAGDRAALAAALGTLALLVASFIFR